LSPSDLSTSLSSSYFKKTMTQVTRSNWIHFIRSVPVKQPWPHFSWMQNLWHDAAVNLSSKRAGCGRSEAARYLFEIVAIFLVIDDCFIAIY